MPRPCNSLAHILRAALAVTALAFAAVPLAPALAQDAAIAQPADPLRANLVDLLANEPALPLPIKQRRDVLLAYYAEGGAVLWLDGMRAMALVERLGAAHVDGLDPADYPAAQLEKLLGVVGETDERSRAIIELFFSAALLEYTSDLSIGRFLPGKVDPNFFLKQRRMDELAALRGVVGAADLAAYFAGWEPHNPDYAGLKSALAHYRGLAEMGGWGVVPLGETLKPGMTDPRVPFLRVRLAVTDDAPGQPPDPAAPELYDDALAAAVMRFQARHGLEVDGAVGPATLVAMNTSIDERIASIEVAMERWRWMPPDLGAQYLIVNIAGFELKRVSAGTVEERMPVVVGKPYNRTPVFSDTIRYLEFNPYWNVPASIALKEELPKLQQNPADLMAQGFEAVRGGEVYELNRINWAAAGPGNFPFQLRQRPGPRNALGQVKFMFPNAHDVYLHDTPSRGLFGRAERAFSHGCIRLARPLDLAVQVLRAGGLAGWDMGRIDNVLASTRNTVVNLDRPLPVHITYLTAWVEDGEVSFRKDIYEHDAKLVAALHGKSLAW